MHDLQIAATARNLDDYFQMFALDENDTGVSFADCAAGASAFAAQVRARGGWAVSVDPLYRDGLSVVRARARHNLDHCEKWLRAHANVIDWDYLGSIEAYRRTGLHNLDVFSTDYAAHPECYIAASLPALGLPERSVDVALCANFLFAYADVLSIDFHVAAIVELARVARREVLVHPLAARDGTGLESFTAAVRQRLSEIGLQTETFVAPGTWLRGASTMRISQSLSNASSNRFPPRRAERNPMEHPRHP